MKVLCTLLVSAVHATDKTREELRRELRQHLVEQKLATLDSSNLDPDDDHGSHKPSIGGPGRKEFESSALLQEAEKAFTLEHEKNMKRRKKRKTQKKPVVPSSLFQTNSRVTLPSEDTPVVHTRRTPDEQHESSLLQGPEHQAALKENMNGQVNYHEKKRLRKEGELKTLDEKFKEEGDPRNVDLVSDKHASACFPANAFVLLEDKSFKMMSEISVGDMIRTGSGFEPVTGFLHADRSSPLTFISLSFENGGKDFATSGDHRVYLTTGQSVLMSDIAVGDVMVSVDGSERVVNAISAIDRHDGYYAPLTSSGTVVVNDVLASVYAGGP